jgi:hypothetical protein
MKEASTLRRAESALGVGGLLDAVTLCSRP